MPPDDPLAQRATPNTGQNDDPRGDAGCACQHDKPAPGPAGLALLTLLALRRRARR